MTIGTSTSSSLRPSSCKRATPACSLLIDELVNIYKVPSITRQYNYEKILTMYNDTLKAQHLGIIMGGTPQCVEDKRRGVYSYRHCATVCRGTLRRPAI